MFTVLGLVLAIALYISALSVYEKLLCELLIIALGMVLMKSIKNSTESEEETWHN